MFVINYGSDATRSAGDAGYSTMRAAMNAFRRMRKAHPEAEMWLYKPERGCLGRMLRRYDPNTGKTETN